MPIGGFVISVDPDIREEIVTMLSEMEGVEVHGSDAKGNIVAVIDTETSEVMDDLVHGLQKDPQILSVGLTYLNAEDEIEKIVSGELRPEIPFGRKKKNRP
ncbi:MAG: chaperone NapD [bacterium]|nr:chaperone NapD [bacterium]MCP4798943.1 chaperone NapD [bacterium]